jgi:hypothetical protein
MLLSANRSVLESSYLSNAYYTETGFDIALRQRVARQWNVELNGSVLNDAYPNESTDDSVTETRADTHLLAGCTVNYEALKWFTIFAGYTMHNRESNIDKYDYNNGIVNGGMKITF